MVNLDKLLGDPFDFIAAVLLGLLLGNYSFYSIRTVSLNPLMSGTSLVACSEQTQSTLMHTLDALSQEALLGKSKQFDH